MNNHTAFRLDDFLAGPPTQTSVPVQVPHGGCFRVHPDTDRAAGPYYLARCDDEWWLIHPDVVSEVRIPSLWRAELYEAQYHDGRTFVIPVTHPLPGRQDWYDTLNQAVDLARKRWASIESDKEQCCYLVRPETKQWLGSPDWLGCDFADLVELAFDGRIIATCQQARKKWPPKPNKRTVTESFDN